MKFLSDNIDILVTTLDLQCGQDSHRQIERAEGN